MRGVVGNVLDLFVLKAPHVVHFVGPSCQPLSSAD